MAKKEPKLKKEKVPKTKKTKKLKLNFKNMKSTSPAIITVIFTFRIIMTVFLFLYPFVFALTSVFDRGAKAMMLYTTQALPSGFTSFFSFGASGTSNVESITRSVPYMLWILFGLLMLLMFFLPFFTSKTKGGKGFLSFYFFLLSGIGFALIYGFQFGLIDLLPHDTADHWSELSQKSRYWQDVKNNFSYQSIWMIFNQFFHALTFVFAIWLAIESDLIRRGKLKYTDLLTNVDASNSLANKVLQGRLEFGNVPDENLHLSINKLKMKLNIDEAVRLEPNDEISEAERIEAERQNREHSELESEIKEGV